MKEQKQRRLSLRGLFFAGLLSFIFVMPVAGEAREQKDMILVLDTSLSMVGSGGRNIMAGVKEGLDKFIDQLEVGDSFTFITFDTEVKLYPIVYIHDKNDKDILKKYVSVVEAKGPWTYTQEMIRNVFKTAQDLELKEKGRQRVIVVLTDALDDPPPARRHERFDIKKIAKQYNNKDWFIFFVNLGDLQTSRQIEKTKKDIKENVSPYTKVVDATETPGKVIEKQLMRDVQDMSAVRRENEKTFLSSPWFLGGLAVLLLAVILLLVRRYMGLRVSGVLDYWNNTILDPYINTVNLTKQESRKISLGRGSGCTVNIRDIEIAEPFTIVARRDKGVIKCALQWGNSYTIEFQNGVQGEFLKDGDVFKVANYTFKYSID